jgi:hypothetical protein
MVRPGLTFLVGGDVRLDTPARPCTMTESKITGIGYWTLDIGIAQNNFVFTYTLARMSTGKPQREANRRRSSSVTQALK